MFNSEKSKAEKNVVSISRRRGRHRKHPSALHFTETHASVSSPHGIGCQMISPSAHTKHVCKSLRFSYLVTGSEVRTTPAALPAASLLPLLQRSDSPEHPSVSPFIHLFSPPQFLHPTSHPVSLHLLSSFILLLSSSHPFDSTFIRSFMPHRFLWRPVTPAHPYSLPHHFLT